MILEPDKRAKFEKDLGQYQNQIRSFIARNGVRIDDVDDIAQEVFIVYYRNFEKKPDDEQLAGWLKGIAKNLCLRYFRSRKTSMKHMESLMDMLSSAEVPFERISCKERAVNALKKCLETLSQKNLNIVKLFYRDGKTYKEIGELFRATAKTVGMTLYRIKTSLKACVERNIS